MPVLSRSLQAPAGAARTPTRGPLSPVLFGFCRSSESLSPPRQEKLEDSGRPLECPGLGVSQGVARGPRDGGRGPPKSRNRRPRASATAAARTEEGARARTRTPENPARTTTTTQTKRDRPRAPISPPPAAGTGLPATIALAKTRPAYFRSGDPYERRDGGVGRSKEPLSNLRRSAEDRPPGEVRAR